jgi:hypothetical protein
VECWESRLTFELSRPWRRGALADRCNMVGRTGRPGCHAGAGRLERTVRPQIMGEPVRHADGPCCAVGQPSILLAVSARCLGGAVAPMAAEDCIGFLAFSCFLAAGRSQRRRRGGCVAFRVHSSVVARKLLTAAPWCRNSCISWFSLQNHGASSVGRRN